MKTIYILMEDADMTTWSHPSPTGQVVYSEEEAKKWVAEADEQEGFGFTRRTYQEGRIEDE
jgi:hypothetical protein